MQSIRVMSNRSRTVLLSPVVVLVVGYAVARISGHLWGVWSWIPVTLVYWITLALIMAFAGGRTEYRRWLQPSHGAWGWRLLSCATTVLFVPVFLLNFRSLAQPWVISSWLVVAIVDPWLEECYWRGLLMDSASGWPGWLIITYTTFWFGLSHPLLLGVNVKVLSGFPGFIGTVFTGVIWSIVYLKTRSLRWPILSHFVADLLSVSVIVFMNRAVLAR
jgi:membrane protease YdiL (CAAX protease family)